MNKPIFSLLLAALLTLHVQAQIPPPDFYGDTINPGYSVWENTGWVADTYGELHPEIKYVTEGATPRAYFWNSCQIAFVLASVDADTTTLDTLRRIDLKFTGEQYQEPEPQVSKEVSYTRNFYFPHCPDGAVDVHGYKKLLYEDIYPDVDLWVYSGARGQKMAFVINPGASPADIQMQFTGQDDMDVDLLGNLRLMLENKWITLPEAVAYQYDEYNNIIPVNWTPQYLVDENSAVVGFAFDDYDTQQPLVLLLGPPPPMGAGGPPWDEPGLCWSTYYGGNSWDHLWDGTKDNNEWLFVTGATLSDMGTFPQIPGILQYGQVETAVLAGFNASDELMWQTFLGADNQYDAIWPFSCAIQHLTGGDRLLVGGTCGDYLPIHTNGVAHHETTPSPGWLGAFEPGVGTRIWLTYIAGDGVDELATNANGRAYFVTRGNSTTSSTPDVTPAPTGSADWPGEEASSEDGMVGMLNGADQLWWYTHIPTPTEDAHIRKGGIAVNDDKVIAVFSTLDGAMEMVPGSQNQMSFTGPTDLVIYEFDPDGVPVWSSYYGSAGIDGVNEGNMVAIDPTTGDFVITGWTGDPGLNLPDGGGWQDATLASGESFAVRFDAATHAVVWGTYMDGNTAESRSEWINCAFGGDGTLYLGGTMNGSFELSPYGGYYYQPDIWLNDDGNVPNDGFIVAISSNNALLWATHFGGIAGYYPEGPVALLERNGQGTIYAVGNTTKGTDPNTYFPLDEGAGPPTFFDHVFGDGLGTEDDGFIAAFCGELWTAAEALSHSPHDLSGSVIAGGILNIYGSSLGQVAYRIFAADGRSVVQGELRGQATGEVTELSVAPLAPGFYIFQCPSGSFRFIRP